MRSRSWLVQTTPGSTARPCAPMAGSSDPDRSRHPQTPPDPSQTRSFIMSKSIILVTGASSGFGLMTAKALAEAGHTVYASMRETTGRNAPQVADVAAWAAENKANLRTAELDVQSDASADAGIAQIIADAGRLDVIVHNAGHMVFGPAEAFTPEQLMQQYDVNVLGAQRVNRAALPHLRGQRKGLLVWVGSSSTRGGPPPFLGPYFAAKA